MKQIIQSFKTGETILEDIPAPEVRRGTVLIRTSKSLVSLGTERMLVEFGKANLVEKARQQPERVKEVLNKIRAEGLLPTLQTVFRKLEQPLPLGYCNVGRVVEVGEDVKEFKIGDRVASNGAHAEFVCIPQNLVAKIPDNVDDEDATFTVIGSIGLQGIRLCKPALGETIVVIGLGLIGLITAELLIANGCSVIGIDLDNQKLQIAQSKGIKTVDPSNGLDSIEAVKNLSRGIGADAVIITASSKSEALISQAARMSRKQGRIILVGSIPLNISRTDFYEKELSFQVSCSYGPGRYDENYEQKGQDYPLPYVRWTEKRNFAAVLHALSTKVLNVKTLITERVDLKDFSKIYANISDTSTIASIIQYPVDSSVNRNVPIGTAPSFTAGTGVVGIVGAGNFTKMTMLPALKNTGASLKYIVSANGVNGTALAKKHRIDNSTTSYEIVLNDNEVDLVMITTRHNQHANMVCKALKAGKHVFVEKPLAININELNEITQAYQATQGKILAVGFNRRFSPHIAKIKQLVGLEPQSPMNIIATMNAGYIPAESWVQDLNIGGGRIVGEACHFFDLISYICNSKIVSVCMNSMGTNPQLNTDNASILLKYANGTNAVVNYLSNGSKTYSKERLEIHWENKSLTMDNFKSTTGFGISKFSKYKSRLNKGHQEQFKELMTAVKTGKSATIASFDQLLNTTKACFAALESLKRGSWVDVESI